VYQYGLVTCHNDNNNGATGISNDGVPGANSLPAGVSAHWAANTITISGTPTASGIFNYSIPLTGGCGALNATGTITVILANTAGSPSVHHLVYQCGFIAQHYDNNNRGNRNLK